MCQCSRTSDHRRRMATPHRDPYTLAAAAPKRAARPLTRHRHRYSGHNVTKFSVIPQMHRPMATTNSGSLQSLILSHMLWL